MSEEDVETGTGTGTQLLQARRKPLIHADSWGPAPCLENRFGPFRSDEGSNPSPSAYKAKSGSASRLAAAEALVLRVAFVPSQRAGRGLKT